MIANSILLSHQGNRCLLFEERWISVGSHGTPALKFHCMKLHVVSVLCSASSSFDKAFSSTPNQSHLPANRPAVIMFPLAPAYAAAPNIITPMLMLWLWLSLCVLGAGNTHISTGDLISFLSLLWNKSKTSYFAVSECHLCDLTATLISTVDRSQAGNCWLGTTSTLESISGENNLFRSPIIIPSLKTLWLMLVRPNSISAALLSRTNSHLWKSMNVRVYMSWSPLVAR